MRKLLCVTIILVFTAGCVDARIKRASNLNVIKAKVAQAEMNAAPNDAEKVKVASQYFQTNIPLLEAVDAYMQGVDPDAKATPAAPVPVTPAQ